MDPSGAPTWSDLIDAWELFRDPILCAVVAGAVLGFLSVYIFLRRMVFVSAAVTQSAALGVALAFYAEIHLATHVEPSLCAAALALFATLVLLIDPTRFHMSREGLLGLVFAGTGGAAVLIGDRISQEAHQIDAILFGTAVLVRDLDLYVIVTMAIVITVVHLWWLRGMSFAAFDEVAARVQGLPVRFLQAVLMVSIGLMVGVSARALGALPVFALSTLPAMAALLFGFRLLPSFVVGAVAGAICGGGGYLLAFFWEFPVGAMQCAAAATLVVVALGFRVITRGMTA
jgi:zinc transport system permease protein